MRIVFTSQAWEQYTSYTDKRILKRIHVLLANIQRNGYEGIGKPEPLRHDLSGFWSRRITSEHRLVYRISAHDIGIIACRYHY